MTSMFGHNIRSELVLLYLFEGLAVFFAVYVLMAAGIPPGYPVDHGRVTLIAAMLAVCSGLVCGASGLYQPQSLSRGRRLFVGAALAGMLLLLTIWLCLLLLAPEGLRASSPGILLEVLLGCIGAVLLTRVAFVLLLRGGFMRRRVLVLPSASKDISDTSSSSGSWEDVFEVSNLPAGADVLSMLRRPESLRAQRVWAVVAPSDTLDAAARRACEAAGVRVLNESEFHECRHNRVVCERLAPDWLSTVRGLHEGRVQAALRRAFDIAVSLTLLVLTLPVMAVTALAIKLDSPGPIFYRQERVGLNGRVFTLTKFRSMIVDAEAGGVARWAQRQDSRVTRVGRLIRLTRIDELPQILNVLRGDMAIVGPRPERPSFVEELGRIIPHYHDRACVKPGITGWAQVNYPYGASVEDARMKLAYDLYYVRRRSLLLDLLILVATVRVVLLQEGAR
ncbi:exopolysaccharide biosynthesis polyprenyl glycosylphosphotransferase [Roseomonas marmotae]|uniref:Exopolysaccharide biosynthesis polyprenyl glycosylphosphotransferase n=3 Tax=Roseomonas marmotae TaxID=2768161 RepID=A0ABS3KH45_9PROT|nr:exopolysaccharide biosynthesis polyprenyl glycosylphosphotransferase [Roseomonas marmotae]QTI78694.1 exopolysaccharide biosynthesis polyprenyl glycosylphosphotransferase [Roseomonas marmotae]